MECWDGSRVPGASPQRPASPKVAPRPPGVILPGFGSDLGSGLVSKFDRKFDLNSVSLLDPTFEYLLERFGSNVDLICDLFASLCLTYDVYKIRASCRRQAHF